jgi:hypothetical protein
MLSGKFIKTTIIDFLNESSVLLAPNGNKSNLPNKLYRYVRTDEFKSWFGDWENNKSDSSKMLDENGEPMIFYHGTKTKFDRFDPDKQKIGWLGRGFYFTDDKIETKQYGRNMLKVFLNIRNPFSVIGNGPNDVAYEIRSKHNSVDIMDVSTTLKENGYDGLIFNHWDQGNMTTCFDPNQIKIINF